MELHTKRLRLAPIRERDIAEIHRMNSFPEVAKYNTIGIPASIEVTERQLSPVFVDEARSERSKFAWSIRLKDTDSFIGEIGMSLAIKKFESAEIYYGSLPEFWGNGYIIEAARQVIEFGFTNLNLHRIEAGVAAENIRSIRLLERLGMTREGLKRKVLPIGGEWKDSYPYAILAEDLR